MYTTIFTNYFKGKVKKHTTIPEILKLIKEGTQDPEILKFIPDGNTAAATEYARAEVKKHGRKTHFYRTVLKPAVPAFTPHGKFIGNSDEHFDDKAGLSGFIYVDIDGVSVDVDKLKTIPYLYAIWNSLSDTGYSMLFKVDPSTYTKADINDVIVQISELNGIPYDPNAKSLSRSVCIPFEPRLWVNDQCKDHKFIKKETRGYGVSDTVINDIDVKSGNESTGVSVSFDSGSGDDSQKPEVRHIKEKKKNYNDSHFRFSDNRRQLKYRSTIDDINQDTYTITKETEDYIYIKEGLPYLEIFLGIADNYKIKVGSRSKRLRTICGILLTINTWASEKQIYRTINMINRDKCQRPLDEKEIEGIVRNIFKQFRAGTLEMMKYAKLKYIWFKPDCKLSRREKLQLSAKKTWERRKEDMPVMGELIREAIECLYSEEKKITQKEVAKAIKKSERHIRSYWTDELVADVKELNQTIKTNSKENKKKPSKPSEPAPAPTPEPEEKQGEEVLKLITEAFKEEEEPTPAAEEKEDHKQVILNFLRTQFTTPIAESESTAQGTGLFVKEESGEVHLYRLRDGKPYHILNGDKHYRLSCTAAAAA